MLLGIPKAAGSFVWASQCFDRVHPLDVQHDVNRPCSEEVGLGIFELLYVISLFVVLVTTKHDVHPTARYPEKASWARHRVARPGRESFMRRGLQAIGGWKRSLPRGARADMEVRVGRPRLTVSVNVNDGDGLGHHGFQGSQESG